MADALKRLIACAQVALRQNAHDMVMTGEECRALDAALAEARAAVEQEAKDAARYRWLRKTHDTSDGTPFICRRVGGRFTHWVNRQADDAIDVSMPLDGAPR